MQLHVAKKTLHSGQAQFVCIALRPLKGLGLIQFVCRRTPKVMGGCRAKRDMSKFVCFVVARLWVWNGLNLLLCAAGTQSGNGKSSIAQILAEWKRHVSSQLVRYTWDWIWLVCIQPGLIPFDIVRSHSGGKIKHSMTEMHMPKIKTNESGWTWFYLFISTSYLGICTLTVSFWV